MLCCVECGVVCTWLIILVRDHTAKDGLSTGAIVGIAVAAVVAFLSALIVLYGLYKRRQRHVKVLAHHEESVCIDEPDLPTAALRTTPFPSSHDLTEPRSSEIASAYWDGSLL